MEFPLAPLGAAYWSIPRKQPRFHGSAVGVTCW